MTLTLTARQCPAESQKLLGPTLHKKLSPHSDCNSECGKVSTLISNPEAGMVVIRTSLFTSNEGIPTTQQDLLSFPFNRLAA